MTDKLINCPRCSNILNKYKMRKIKHPTGAILDVCDYCSGMWIDGPEVKLLNLSLKSSHNKIVKQGVKQWQKKKIG